MRLRPRVPPFSALPADASEIIRHRGTWALTETDRLDSVAAHELVM
jgi:hypothetical protein